MVITDTDRLNWLESRYTLHYGIEFLYVVDGIEGVYSRDGNELVMCHGSDLREVIDKLMVVLSATDTLPQDAD